MANLDRRTLNYVTDTDITVQIQIAYEDSDTIPVTPDQRLTTGNFAGEEVESCAGITTRRILKPRYIEFDFGDGQILRVYYRTYTAFKAAIDGGDTSDVGSNGGVAKRYFGEQYCVNS